MKFSTSACLQFILRSQSFKLLALPIAAGVVFSLTGCGGAPAANANRIPGVNDPNNTGGQSSSSSSSGSQNSPTQQPSNPPVQQPSNPPPPPPPSDPPPPPDAKITSQIQTLDGWTWCTAKLHGQTCASGEGNAESSMTAKQQTPSLSGSSSMFWIGGKTHYSNALWWRELGPDSKPTHFNYDLYFYMEDSGAPRRPWSSTSTRPSLAPVCVRYGVQLPRHRTLADLGFRRRKVGRHRCGLSAVLGQASGTTWCGILSGSATRRITLA